MQFEAIHKQTKEKFTEFSLTIWQDGSGHITLLNGEEIDLNDILLFNPIYSINNHIHTIAWGGESQK